MSSFHSGLTRPQQPRTVMYLASLAAMIVLVAQAIPFSVPAAQAGESVRKSVLELFTSQGCSSCPPADALLARLARRDDIVALTMPVNYWDHLGWKDTLAMDIFTERQRSYAETRGDREIYTPQLVVNGVEHVVGSRPDEIEDAVRRTSRRIGAAWVPLALQNDDEAVSLEAGAAPIGSAYHGGTVWFAFFNHAIPVDIRRGENTGVRITYTNVVRSLQRAGHWDGEAASFHAAIPRGLDIDGCAAFLQADGTRIILGATIARLARE
jgi:hypothetical protein